MRRSPSDAAPAARRASSRSRTTPPSSAPPSALDDAGRDLVELLDRNDGERPWRIRELGSSMLEELRRARRGSKMVAQLGIVEGLRDRYEHVVVEDQGDIFNSGLTQALELAYLIDLAAVMINAGIARKESRGAHARPHDYPDRDDENCTSSTRSRPCATGRPSCPGRMCA